MRRERTFSTSSRTWVTQNMGVTKSDSSRALHTTAVWGDRAAGPVREGRGRGEAEVVAELLGGRGEAMAPP
jgi:hypothetical protein